MKHPCVGNWMLNLHLLIIITNPLNPRITIPSIDYTNMTRIRSERKESTEKLVLGSPSAWTVLGPIDEIRQSSSHY
jgi:hypothetical protein